MLRSTKNKSVVNLLRNRELNIRLSPYFSSLSIISQLLRSETSLLYTNFWTVSSNRRVAYEYGLLYFSDFTKFCNTYNEVDAPSSFTKLQKSSAKKKVSDVITYSIPLYKNIDEFCECSPSRECFCLTQYVLTISEDNWLCQHKISDGRIIKELYVARYGSFRNFKYCDWDVYSERFVLTSTLNPGAEGDPRADVVVYFAVFTVFPIEFFALLEINRSIFGSSCSAANVSDQHLILGLGSSQVRIYSFEALLQQGKRTPYKLGDEYSLGKIGYSPVGLPLNFTYDEAPPLLFDIQCGSQVVRFGGYPYHYIIKSTSGDNSMCVRNILTDNVASDGIFRSGSIDDQLNSLTFHPDHSNRLIFKTEDSVHCYKIISADGESEISQLFSMDFVERRINNQPGISSYGRKIKRVDYAAFDHRCSILSTDYASDLDIFAILGICSRSNLNGFVKLFDGISGEQIRTIELKRPFCDSKIYELIIDMGCIIVIERGLPTDFTVIVCNL